MYVGDARTIANIYPAYLRQDYCARHFTKKLYVTISKLHGLACLWAIQWLVDVKRVLKSTVPVIENDIPVVFTMNLGPWQRDSQPFSFEHMFQICHKGFLKASTMSATSRHANIPTLPHRISAVASNMCATSRKVNIPTPPYQCRSIHHVSNVKESLHPHPAPPYQCRSIHHVCNFKER